MDNSQLSVLAHKHLEPQHLVELVDIDEVKGWEPCIFYLQK